MKNEEDYLKQQSLILQKSLDFWQDKIIEQVEYIELLEADESCSEEDFNSAGAELTYLMTRLQWNSNLMNNIEEKIKLYFKNKKK